MKIEDINIKLIRDKFVYTLSNLSQDDTPSYKIVHTDSLSDEQIISRFDDGKHRAFLTPTGAFKLYMTFPEIVCSKAVNETLANSFPETYNRSRMYTTINGINVSHTTLIPIDVEKSQDVNILNVLTENKLRDDALYWGNIQDSKFQERKLEKFKVKMFTLADFRSKLNEVGANVCSFNYKESIFNVVKDIKQSPNKLELVLEVDAKAKVRDAYYELANSNVRNWMKYSFGHELEDDDVELFTNAFYDNKGRKQVCEKLGITVKEFNSFKNDIFNVLPTNTKSGYIYKVSGALNHALHGYIYPNGKATEYGDGKCSRLLYDQSWMTSFIYYLTNWDLYYKFDQKLPDDCINPHLEGFYPSGKVFVKDGLVNRLYSITKEEMEAILDTSLDVVEFDDKWCDKTSHARNISYSYIDFANNNQQFAHVVRDFDVPVEALCEELVHVHRIIDLMRDGNSSQWNIESIKDLVDNKQLNASNNTLYNIIHSVKKDSTANVEPNVQTSLESMQYDQALNYSLPSEIFQPTSTVQLRPNIFIQNMDRVVGLCELINNLGHSVGSIKGWWGGYIDDYCITMSASNHVVLMLTRLSQYLHYGVNGRGNKLVRVRNFIDAYGYLTPLSSISNDIARLFFEELTTKNCMSDSMLGSPVYEILYSTQFDESQPLHITSISGDNEQSDILRTMEPSTDDVARELTRITSQSVETVRNMSFAEFSFANGTQVNDYRRRDIENTASMIDWSLVREGRSNNGENN